MKPRRAQSFVRLARLIVIVIVMWLSKATVMCTPTAAAPATTYGGKGRESSVGGAPGHSLMAMGGTVNCGVITGADFGIYL